MKVLNISEDRFNSLEKFQLADDISNMESELFVFVEKNKWLKRNLLLKKLFLNSGTTFSNKLFTINELIDKKEVINIEEFVMPEKLISVSGNIVGFTMPLINNINFKHILNSNYVSNEQKIEYFIEIGQLLERMKNVRRYTGIKDFYLGDIHENNFILNKDNGKINVVDLDSCKINGNNNFISKYLYQSDSIINVSKYISLDNPYGIRGLYQIDENTDLFCYVMMILNYISGINIVNLSIDEYYDFLDYLHTIGVSSELIDIFSLVYIEKDNVNPYEYLDELSKVVGRSHSNVYKLVKNK